MSLLAAPAVWPRVPKEVVLARPLKLPVLKVMLPEPAKGEPAVTLTFKGVAEPIVMLPAAVDVAVTLRLKWVLSGKPTTEEAVNPVPVAVTLATEEVSNTKPEGKAQAKVPI